ncbi:MAG: polyprenyl synthetase family protein [Candidatus Moraniibacteriota bacterium]
MDIQQTLKEFKADIDVRLETYFDRMIAEIREKDPMMAEHLAYVKRYTLAGGKRLRSALVYYGYVAAGGKDTEAILDTSICIELLHSFLLIHDDIMDRDAMRHGIPTVHEHYTQMAGKHFPLADEKHFGQSMALIMGDIIGALGNQVLFTSPFPAEIIVKALNKYQSIVWLTVIGQSQDFWIEHTQEATEEEILRMYEYKTARYTMEGPLQMGTILMGGSSTELEGALSRYAVPIGIAFQIQDDILGIFGEEKKLGKPMASDLIEGKYTLLVAKALKHASREQAKQLRFLLKKGTNIQEGDIEIFRRLLNETGALEETKRLALEYIETGKQELLPVKNKMPQEAYDFLIGIADHMATREY